MIVIKEKRLPKGPQRQLGGPQRQLSGPQKYLGASQEQREGLRGSFEDHSCRWEGLEASWGGARRVSAGAGSLENHGWEGSLRDLEGHNRYPGHCLLQGRCPKG